MHLLPTEVEVEDLAKPEFEGLWEQHKPYKVPKDVSSAKPPGASKMDKEILQRTLEKHREGIIVKQVAAGKEFSGCPFYSKPDIIHFKVSVGGCARQVAGNCDRYSFIFLRSIPKTRTCISFTCSEHKRSGT